MARRRQAETLDPEAAALSNKISETRRQRGLSQQGLAEHAGISIGTVRAIETGRVKDPGVFTICRIASALDISLNDIVGTDRIDQVVIQRDSHSGHAQAQTRAHAGGGSPSRVDHADSPSSSGRAFMM